MTSSSGSGNTYVDIDDEISALQNLFPTISRSEFYHVETGTIGAKLRYIPTASEHDVFDVLMEYPRSYPLDPPRMWVTNPSIEPNYEMVIEFDHRNDARADYLHADDWDSSLNGFHAATVMKSWIARYCQWLEGDPQPETLDDTLSELSAAVRQYRNRD